MLPQPLRRLLRRKGLRTPKLFTLTLCLLLILPLGCDSVSRTSSQGLGQTALNQKLGQKLALPAGAAGSMALGEQILVDQLGWRPDAAKIGLFANPKRGQNTGQRYQPGEAFELRRDDNNDVVYRGELVAWHNGQTDRSSGDQVWSADFSNYRTPGRYYLYDPDNQLRSHAFDIDANPYGAALTAAVKAFYYQRCGTAIPSEYGGNWTHPPCHIHANQDQAAASYVPDKKIRNGQDGFTIRGGQDGKTIRDVHGGWHDAGDFNKYLPFTAKTLWNLLDAYEQNPNAFGDRSNIPESGNGVPDLLDEVKWELDWMLRMQLEDGSVANRVASQEVGEHFPQQDRDRRYYTAPTTWATSAFIVGTANASRIFQQFEGAYPGYGDRLLAAAEQAWQFLEQHPQMFPSSGRDYGDMLPLSPASQADEEGDDNMLRLWAAAELFRATENRTYKKAFAARETVLKPDWFDPYQDLAYITYARSKGADATIVAKLKSALADTLHDIDNLDADGVDPYRAYIDHYHWGSNQSKGNWGLMFLAAQQLGLNDRTVLNYQQNAEEYLHYFHGRNPLGWVYLSNMGEKGAKTGVAKSVMALYHGWFHSDSVYGGAESKYGPAPGFVTGGPNEYYAVKAVKPPYGEPPQKAFRDWNTEHKVGGQSEASWEITEPAIYYQAAYVDLLSYFARSS